MCLDTRLAVRDLAGHSPPPGFHDGCNNTDRSIRFQSVGRLHRDRPRHCPAGGTLRHPSQGQECANRRVGARRLPVDPNLERGHQCVSKKPNSMTEQTAKLLVQFADYRGVNRQMAWEQNDRQASTMIVSRERPPCSKRHGERPHMTCHVPACAIPMRQSGHDDTPPRLPCPCCVDRH